MPLLYGPASPWGPNIWFETSSPGRLETPSLSSDSDDRSGMSGGTGSYFADEEEAKASALG